MDDMMGTVDGNIEMEFDGAVLCHIINLFSVTLDHGQSRRQSTRQSGRQRQRDVTLLPDRCMAKSCEFPFGELVWATAGDKMHAHFTPGDRLESGK